jgi:hypothetical protein
MDAIVKEKIEKLGQVGEKIVRNYLNKLRDVSVEDSTNLYDNKKDLIMEIVLDENSLDDESASFKTLYRNEADDLVEIRTGEVKTNTPYFIEDMVSFHKSQLDKCRNVDDLYFVTVPSIKFQRDYSGWILRVDPKNFDAKAYTKKDPSRPGGVRHMIGIKIDQPSVTKLRKLYKSELEGLLPFSTENLNKQQIEFLVNLYGEDDPVRRLVA